MKKCIITVSIALITITSINASQIKEGELIATPGIGIGSPLFNGSFYSVSIPPFSSSFEYGLANIEGPAFLGIGAFIGISGSRYESSVLGSVYGYKYFSSIFGLRGYFHYEIIEELDTYGGIMAGYNFISNKEFGTSLFPSSPLNSRPAYGIFAGARYYLNDQFGIMAEAGYGTSFLIIGITYKIK